MNDLGNIKNLKSISFDRATDMVLYEGKKNLVDKAKKEITQRDLENFKKFVIEIHGTLKDVKIYKMNYKKSGNIQLKTLIAIY